MSLEVVFKASLIVCETGSVAYSFSGRNRVAFGLKSGVRRSEWNRPIGSVLPASLVQISRAKSDRTSGGVARIIATASAPAVATRSLDNARERRGTCAQTSSQYQPAIPLAGQSPWLSCPARTHSKG